MTEAFKFQQFSEFRVSTGDAPVKNFDKFSSAVGWTAANYRLAPGQTSELSTTGEVVIDGDTIKITGKK